MEAKRTIGWMCIGIERLVDAGPFVDYKFVSDVYEASPNRRSGSVVVGQVIGTLRIRKDTGEVTLAEAMPGDDSNARFRRAARKIKEHWESGQLPDKTMFACG